MEIHTVQSDAIESAPGATPDGQCAALTTALTTASGMHVLDLRIANNFFTRLRGLMGARPLLPNQGMLITSCPGVHSAFMRYPIDVVYLDRQGTVTKCVACLRPWRASDSRTGRDGEGRRYPRARYTLELAAGSIETLSIQPGDRLRHRLLATKPVPSTRAPPSQRGAAMIEFTVVGPIITMLGLAVLQYAMLFFAKQQLNHASFMAAREGATINANMGAVRAAYVRALVPMYGGGQSPAQLALSLARANADTAGNVNIELLNPTRESFADWNDTDLQAALKTGGKRVIPNVGQAFKNQDIGPASGQSIQDANLIKLRITHGYLPKVPLISRLYTKYLKWQDLGDDAFHTRLVNDGRIPVVTHITLHMQSDAIEPDAPVSSPGQGNGGTATNPGDPSTTSRPPPSCTTASCGSAEPAPSQPCDPLSDTNHCSPPTGCSPGDISCDPACGSTICCVPNAK